MVSGLKVITESSYAFSRVSCQGQLVTNSIVDEVVGACFLTQMLEALSLSLEELSIRTIFVVFNVSRCVDPFP
jgi:hypothetical protein